MDAGCVELLTTAASVSGRRPVRLGGHRLMVQTTRCAQRHGSDCLSGVGKHLRARLWLELEVKASCDDSEFTFTNSGLMLASTVELHTEYGWLRCLPTTEYALWRKAGLCQEAPLVLLLDDVVWRVIASMNAAVVSAQDTASALTLAEDTDPVFRLYLEAHHNGGQLHTEVLKATARGEQDLHAHRQFLFKVFHVIDKPPTLSHDLSKTKLVNFARGRCFSRNNLQLLQRAISVTDCMALVKRLHRAVENHHPEHGPPPVLSVLDMYVDRVSRSVQKIYGWNNKAWHIPKRFMPPAYKKDLVALEAQYGHLNLTDPGDIQIPTLLPGAQLDVKWEDE